MFKKKKTQGVYLPLWLCKCIWQLFMNIFYSETAWPIKAKKHVEAPRDRGMKVCITCPRHMAKMSTLQIYGKSLLKSPEPDVQ